MKRHDSTVSYDDEKAVIRSASHTLYSAYIMVRESAETDGEIEYDSSPSSYDKVTVERGPSLVKLVDLIHMDIHNNTSGGYTRAARSIVESITEAGLVEKYYKKGNFSTITCFREAQG